MFGESNLLRDGVEGKAIILDARPGNVLNRHGERNWHLQLRVHFDDGQTGDVSSEFVDMGIATVGPASGLEPYPLSAGVVVPVRYDRGDHTKVVVDRPQMIADTIAAYQADQAKKIERAERQFAPAAPASQQGDESDENYLMDALAAAQTRGDTAEVARLTGLVEKLIAG